MPFRYLVLSLRNNDNLRLFAAKYDKTTRNNEINEALID